MPTIRIQSASDPRISDYAKLAIRSRRSGSPSFVVEGQTLVHRLLKSRLVVKSLLVEQRHIEKFGRDLPPDIPLFAASAEDICQIVGYEFHRGVLACGVRPAKPSIDGLIDSLPASSVVVICAGVCDPENVGGILRSARAFGVDAIVLGDGSADPFSRRVVRVSMGAVLEQDICESGDLNGDLVRLGEAGVELYATVLDEDAESLGDVKRWRKRVGLMFGSEANGLDHHWIKKASRRVTIPLSDAVDSLNVAVAAGVFLHHFSPFKQL